MGYIRNVILGIALTILLYKILMFVKLMDFNKLAYNHQPGPCKILEEIEHGSEDIQVLANGLAFISSGLRFVGLNEAEANKRKGQIFLFDFKNPNDKPRALSITGHEFTQKDFNPHGISLWQDLETEKVTLFVVNHLLDEDRIEKFNFNAESMSLLHLRSITSTTFRYTNDIVAISEDTFYVTNFYYYRSNAEVILGLQWGSVAYYDGHQGHIVLSHLNGPNGINRKKGYLFVAMGGEKSIYVYKIEQDHSLNFSQALWLGTACDNIDVPEASNDIWLGCHPVVHILLFGGYMVHPGKFIAPSQVLKIKVQDSGLLEDSITEVYSNDGRMHSASTIAVSYDNAMLIGNIYTTALYCDIKHY